MWRGGLRYSLSVAAPFVWRCLNSRTISPFPHPPVLVQRMFVPADPVIALGIYCRYCILRHRILTELIFGGHDARQTEGTPDRASQGLAELREVGGTPRYRAGPLRHRVCSRVGRRQHQCPGATLSRERPASGRVRTAARRAPRQGHTHSADRASAAAALRSS